MSLAADETGNVGNVSQLPPQVAEAMNTASATPATETPSTRGSGLRKQFWVKMSDREFEVWTTPGDAVRYEQYAKKPLFSMDKDGKPEIYITAMMFLAWSAAKRAGHYAGKFTQFQEDNEDFADITDEDEEPDPTQMPPGDA